MSPTEITISMFFKTAAIATPKCTMLQTTQNTHLKHITAVETHRMNLKRQIMRWKLAKVIPIHKSDSKLDVSNYRPISILPVLSKVFEKHTRNPFDIFVPVCV